MYLLRYFNLAHKVTLQVYVFQFLYVYKMQGCMMCSVHIAPRYTMVLRFDTNGIQSHM